MSAATSSEEADTATSALSSDEADVADTAPSTTAELSTVAPSDAVCTSAGALSCDSTFGVCGVSS